MKSSRNTALPTNTPLRPNSKIIELLAELLYGDKTKSLPEITEKSIIQRSRKFPTFDADDVISKADSDPYYRIQIVLNIMSEMGDKEIFKLVGIGEI